MPDLGREDRALPARLGGVDAARGLAVLGMFAAHVGNADTGSVATDWLVVTDGPSSAVFAVLAGVSLALLSGGAHPGGRDVHLGVAGGRDVHPGVTGRREVRAMDTRSSATRASRCSCWSAASRLLSGSPGCWCRWRPRARWR